MKVLSHRGLWLHPAEKNADLAFERSFDAGFGTETDVRDRLGELVISHDMPRGGESSFDDFLSRLRGRDLPLAVNIKADGLARPVREALLRHGVRDWFVFDMSVPDMREHLRLGNPVFARVSEVERHPPWLERCAGIWLDAFEGEWFTAQDVEALLQGGRRVCVVSPELHGRDPAAAWHALRALAAAPGLMLCTDRPHDATAFFGLHGGDGSRPA
jgi:glycerophosphoryl diester phosphodiesterase